MMRELGLFCLDSKTTISWQIRLVGSTSYTCCLSFGVKALRANPRYELSWNYKPTLLKSSSRSWKEIKALRHYGNHWVLENSANVGLSGTRQSEGCHLTTDLPTLAWLF